MTIEIGKKTAVTVTIGVAQSNREDIKARTFSASWDSQKIYCKPCDIDLVPMIGQGLKVEDEGKDYMTWAMSIGDGGIIVITIEKA